MSHDDPFGDHDDERTVIKPTPGGRRASPPPGSGSDATVPPPPRAPQSASNAPVNRSPLATPTHLGLNPLEQAASGLLNLLTRIKNTASHPDPTGLRNQMVAEIQAFEARAKGLGATPEIVFSARYALCTVIDEAVLDTPWGSNSPWHKQSLLSLFHKETWGGEKFFRLLDKVSQDPARNIDLLELLYCFLALGFQGRYRVLDNGLSRLEEVREKLYRLIRNQRGEFERELSPNWRGVVDKRNPLERNLPLWAAAAFTAAILLAVFMALNYFINQGSNPAFAELQKMGRSGTLPSRPQTVVVVPTPAPTPEPPPTPPAIAAFLAPEVAAGLVEVIETGGSTMVRVRGKGLFKSGRAKLTDEFLPIIERIGEALMAEEGDVLVTGHTDSDPIFTARFPSNFHLSQSRAETVAKLLSERTGQSERFSAEGLGDATPLVANDSRDNKARNRRAEITLQGRVRRSPNE